MCSSDLLQDQAAALAPVGELSSALTQTQSFVENQLKNQPQGTLPITALVRQAASVTGTSIPISSISITYHGLPEPGDSLNPCPSPNPFDSDITVGCLTFAAVAESREQISEFLRNLEADELFVGPYVTGTSLATDLDGNTTVSVSGTVGLATGVLLDKPTDEELEAIINPASQATPEADPTTDSSEVAP